LKRVLDYDPVTRITTTFDYDFDTDTTILHRSQPGNLVQSLLDVNKTLQNEEDYTKQGIKSGWWHYATIPNIVAEDWLNRFGVNIYNKDHEKKVFELLNRPEYRYLKTTTKMHRG